MKSSLDNAVPERYVIVQNDCLLRLRYLLVYSHSVKTPQRYLADSSTINRSLNQIHRGIVVDFKAAGQHCDASGARPSLPSGDAVLLGSADVCGVV